VNQTITSGESATLGVVANGTAPLTYQWYQGTSPDVSNPIGGATSSSYATGALNTGVTHWVRVSNVCGTADSQSASISITRPVFLSIDSVSPASGARGSTIASFTVFGSGLAQTVSLSFSSTDIRVASYVSRSATAITVTLEIDPKAGIGPRNVVVINSLGNVATLADGFRVTAKPANTTALVGIVVDNREAFGLAEAMASNETVHPKGLLGKVKIYNYLRIWLGVTASVPTAAYFAPDTSAGLEGTLAKLRLLPPCPSPTIFACHSSDALPSAWSAAFTLPARVDLTLGMSSTAFGLNMVQALLAALGPLCPSCPSLPSVKDVVDVFQRLDSEVPLFHDALNCFGRSSPNDQALCVVEELSQLVVHPKQLARTYRIVIAQVIDLDPRHITLEDVLDLLTDFKLGAPAILLEMLGDEIVLGIQATGTSHPRTLEISLTAQ